MNDAVVKHMPEGHYIEVTRGGARFEVGLDGTNLNGYAETEEEAVRDAKAHAWEWLNSLDAGPVEWRTSKPAEVALVTQWFARMGGDGE